MAWREHDTVALGVSEAPSGSPGCGVHLAGLFENADIRGMTRADRLHALLTQAFAPSVLHVQDDSARHAGHAGAQPGGQTHFNVLLVSVAFQGMARVARARAVHAALDSEFGPAEQGGCTRLR